MGTFVVGKEVSKEEGGNDKLENKADMSEVPSLGLGKDHIKRFRPILSSGYLLFFS